MKRMTVEEWQALPTIDKEVLRTLNLSSLLEPKLVPGEARAPESYILHRVTHCTLCQTTFEEFFRMSPLEGSSILHSGGISFKDILPDEDIKHSEWSVSTCSHCYTVLSKESRLSLIKRLVALSKKRN